MATAFTPQANTYADLFKNLYSTPTDVPAAQPIGVPTTPESKPLPNLKDLTATSMVEDPLAANIAAAPSLEKISDIINSINQKAQQQANLSRTGGSGAYDQSILDNINRMAQGYISPETIAETQASAAQQWGGRGFGVDTPAMQAAVRRTLGLQREDLAKEAASEYATYLGAHPSAPIADVSKFMVTPESYAQAQEAADARKLQLAELQQKGEISRAEMNQQIQLANQQLALKQQELAQSKLLEQQRLALEAQQQQQRLDQERAAAYAAAYEKFYPTTTGYATPPVTRTPTLYGAAQSAADLRLQLEASRQEQARRLAAQAVGGYVNPVPNPYAALTSYA